MDGVANQISDLNILSLVRENNLTGWEQLYDKYAPIMYSVICTYTTDMGLADKILINLFLRLKDEKIFLKMNFTLCVFILSYTFTNTRKELKKRGIYYTESPFEVNLIIHTLFSKTLNIGAVAANLKMSEIEVTQNLLNEFLTFRSQNKYPGQI